MILLLIIATLVPTFLISRLLLWLSKKWQGGYYRYVAVHALSGGLAVALAAIGNADGGPLRWDVGLIYLGAQAIWLAVDILAYRGRLAAQAAKVET